MATNDLLLAYLLILAGILLLGAELFFPSGIMLVLAVSAIAIGIVLTFAYDPTVGVLTLIAVVVLLPGISSVLLRYWPQTAIGKRFFLKGPEEDATVASMAGNQELERLRGRHGRTVSALKPSGITDFDGWRVDTITEGMMVEAGQWVRCIDVQAGRVLVRPIEKPDLGDLETAIFR